MSPMLSSCWILSLCSAIKGCISETFSLDEHFQVQRLLIKYWSLNDKIPQNYTLRQLRRIPKKTFHFHFHAPWLILHIRTTTRSQRLLASRILPPIITQMFEIKPPCRKIKVSLPLLLQPPCAPPVFYLIFRVKWCNSNTAARSAHMPSGRRWICVLHSLLNSFKSFKFSANSESQ